jgi:hypothetical protein
MQTGGRVGIKEDPPSKIFTKLVNKHAIELEKGVPSQKNVHNPYMASTKKFGKNLPPGF